MTELLFCCQQKVVNRDRRQDVALEMVRNSTAAKQSQVRPSNQLLLASLHFMCDILATITVQPGGPPCMYCPLPLSVKEPFHLAK